MIQPLRSHRLAIAAGCALAVAILPTPPAFASSAPHAVRQAQSSVVQIVKTAGNDKGAAFAIDDRGDFLTTQQTVSRSAGLRVTVPGSSTQYAAERLESDAPPGLVLIRVHGAPRLPALTFSHSSPQISDRTWVVPARAVSPRARGGTVQLPDQLCTSGSDTGLLTVGVDRTAGLNGSPVLDASGAVVGVVRANRFTSKGCRRSVVQAVAATQAPQPLPALPPLKSSDFPAVPVVGGVIAALLAINLVLFVGRRRRFAGAAAITAAAPAAAPPVTRYDDGLDDADLEIALKPKHGASPPAEADEPDVRLR